ncbi:hypothetical protein F4805DRAFT_475327 [Annulohypoxylon moriforme]|nr:hypothetical protein F4805DRAFT_475327 [Annulohypoxylon moriforme]
MATNPAKPAPKDLEAIWRVYIDRSTTTSQMIEVAVAKGQDPIIFTNEDDGFYAFLGSDHGKGPARMLASYAEMFGGKFPHKLIAYNGQESTGLDVPTNVKLTTLPKYPDKLEALRILGDATAGFGTMPQPIDWVLEEVPAPMLHIMGTTSGWQVCSGP